MADLLTVFLRAPRRGGVKTRLAAELGDDEALRIYRELVARVLGALPPRLPVELRHTPDDASGEVAPWLRPGWESRPQGAGDLGARLARASAEAFARGVRRWLVIGTDAPELTAADLAWALATLESHDAVLGPAVDGGYWLLGLSRPAPALFEGIPWGTETVAADTEGAAKASGLRMGRLRELADIDVAADWRAWQRRLAP